MRLLAAIVLVVASSGCAFEHGASSGDDSTGPDAAVSPGGGSDSTGTPVSRTCHYPDPSLRLCLEFDDGSITPVVHDASSGQLDATASGLHAAMRGSDPAVQTSASNSTIAIAETASLDIGDAITLEAWVRPNGFQAASVIQNTNQYILLTDGLGNVGCSLAGTTLLTNDVHVAPNEWTHIACTFANGKLHAYLNGTTKDCQTGTATIARGGTQGTRIAPNFTGDIDGVRIYARELSSTELCTHAGQTNCLAACNIGGGGE